jgi:hypothetical protein
MDIKKVIRMLFYCLFISTRFQMSLKAFVPYTVIELALHCLHNVDVLLPCSSQHDSHISIRILQSVGFAQYWKAKRVNEFHTNITFMPFI